MGYFVLSKYIPADIIGPPEIERFNFGQMIHLETGPTSYTMRVLGAVKNIGTVPASNLRIHFVETTHQYLRDVVKDREEVIRSSKCQCSALLESSQLCQLV